uniref:Pex N-terminal domain-containing protein n=1 Tax=Arion vulgaris TaxID=1028688 RepID=A0A0B6ZPX6_9EUPU
MAEHGAHLTSGGVTDTNRPSVFEVLAQENLMSTIRPAIRHALRVFSERYPEQLGRLIQNFDEIFLLLDTLVQSYYLKKYGGSFAENFYDLKRVPSGSPDQPLLSKHRMMSVACLVLIPYVRQKLDSYFEMLQYKEGSRQGLSFLQCMTLAYILSYILRGGRWHNPNMHLSGTELRRLDPDEELNGSDKLHDPAWSELNTTAKLSLLARMSLNTTAACLSTSLSVGVFSYSFWTGGMPVTTVHQL